MGAPLGKPDEGWRSARERMNSETTADTWIWAKGESHGRTRLPAAESQGLRQLAQVRIGSHTKAALRAEGRPEELMEVMWVAAEMREVRQLRTRALSSGPQKRQNSHHRRANLEQIGAGCET